MRPPGGILSPGESIIATGKFFFLLMLFLNDFSNGCNNQLISRMYFLKKTSTPVAVFKFVEQPENNEKPMDQKSKVKFKIVSLKVNGPMEYVPELVSLFLSLPFSLIPYVCFSMAELVFHFAKTWNFSLI